MRINQSVLPYVLLTCVGCLQLPVRLLTGKLVCDYYKVECVV